MFVGHQRQAAADLTQLDPHYGRDHSQLTVQHSHWTLVRQSSAVDIAALNTSRNLSGAVT